jgi:hypothetical protein
MDLGKIGWSGVDWIGLAQDRNRWRALVNAVMNPPPPDAFAKPKFFTPKNSVRSSCTGLYCGPAAYNVNILTL